MASVQSETILSDYSCPFGIEYREAINQYWLNKHPGGYDNINSAYEVEENGSKMLFLSYHIGHDLKHVFNIGESMGYQLPKQTSLHEEINDIFVNIQKEHWIHLYISRIYSFVITMFFVLTKLLVLFRPSFLLHFIHGAFSLTYLFAVFHTRLHCGKKLYGHKLIDSIMNSICDLSDNINFLMPSKRWIHSHHKSHHLYTNTIEDHQVYTPYPLINVSKYFKTKPYHKYQTFYAIILYSISSLTSWTRQLGLFKDSITNKPIGNRNYLLIHIVMNIILPYYYYGIYPIFIWITIRILFGAFSVYLFQVSHSNVELKQIKYDKNNFINNDYDKWVKNQIETSLTWSSDSYLSTLIFGGINTQIEHHIAPSIHPIFYCFASKHIQQLCEKYNFKYSKRANFIQALTGHHKYLYNVINKA